MSNSLVSAAERSLKDYLAVKNTESILLIYDDSTVEIAGAFKVASEKNKLKFTMHRIEATGGHGREPDIQTSELMKKFDVVLAPTKYSLTHTNAAINARKAGARIATLPGVNSMIFVEGLKTDPHELYEAGEKLRKVLSGPHLIHVRTAAGTDISFKIGKYPVFNDCGLITKTGTFGNLPAGEVFLAPDERTASGILVFDGTVGGLEARERSYPVKVRVKDGMAVEFEPEDACGLRDRLGSFGEKAFLLAEFGIGTNPDLRMTGNFLGDEKLIKTVHFAFGNNCTMGGSNSVQVHIDSLVLSPDVFVDGQQIMNKGNLQLSV